MKSFKDRQNEQLIREFVGPNGQVDPMAVTANIPVQLQQFLRSLAAKTPAEIIKVKAALDTEITKLLSNKNNLGAV